MKIESLVSARALFGAKRIRRPLGGLVFALLLAAVASTTFLVGRSRSQGPIEIYIAMRTAILANAAARAPKGQVLLIGDSLSEQSGIVSLCGRPVFNAGISGAKLVDVARPSQKLARVLQPSLTVVAIGTNDAIMQTSPDGWAADYHILTRGLPRPLALVAIPKVEDHSQETEVEIERLNAALRAIADGNGAVMVSQIHFPTSDGVHQTPHGAKIWRDALQAACRNL